jgi:RNA polymerase sigma-70 factor (ECF subfamily)
MADPAVFERVFAQHERGVYGAAYRVLGDHARAQDVVQDVFLRIWRKPDRFDPNRGDIGPYLKLMARSRALDLWREGDAANRAGDRLKAVVTHEAQIPVDRPDQLIERRESQDEVLQVLRELPETQREAIALSYWGEMTAEEIAEKTGVPVGTAKSRMRLGLTRLRGEYSQDLRAA